MGLFLWDSEPSKIFVGDTPISKVFLWDTKIRPSGWWGWQPWANTIAYYPLETDANDYSWNNKNPTTVGSAVTFWTDSDGNKCAKFIANTNSYISYWTSWSAVNFWTTDITIAFWLGDLTNNTGSTWSYSNWILTWQYWWSHAVWMYIAATPNVWSPSIPQGSLYFGSSWYHPNGLTSYSLYWVNWMHCYVLTTDTSWNYTLYIDGTSYKTSTFTAANLSWNNCYMWYDPWDSNTLRHLVWNLRQVVFENKKWTAQEVSDYYNSTK